MGTIPAGVFSKEKDGCQNLCRNQPQYRKKSLVLLSSIAILLPIRYEIEQLDIMTSNYRNEILQT